MTNLLSPKMPKMPAGMDTVARTPQVDEARKTKDDIDDVLRRRGAGYNILTSETGLPDLGVTKRKTAGGGGGY